MRTVNVALKWKVGAEKLLSNPLLSNPGIDKVARRRARKSARKRTPRVFFEVKGKTPAKASKVVDIHDKLPAVDDMVAVLPETVVEMLKGCKVCTRYVVIWSLNMHAYGC
jgi:hypothetical protein